MYEDMTEVQQLVYICLMHRTKHGYGEETPLQLNDCDTLSCQQDCPIAKMPNALTYAETRSD